MFEIVAALVIRGLQDEASVADRVDLQVEVRSAAEVPAALKAAEADAALA